ncbi:Aspartate transaminase [Actinobacteria bacterium OK074]|nr:Aspartate transaminase [Actinobacteria bacterium OK074]
MGGPAVRRENEPKVSLRQVSGRWQSAAPDEIPLHVADMDFMTSPEVTAALGARVRRPLPYPEQDGDSAAVACLVDRYRLRYGTAVDAEDIWLVAGIVSASTAAMAELFAPHDEVLYFAPSYHVVPGTIAAAGCRPVPVPLDPERGLDPAALRAAVGPATRGIYLCNPHNPTGHVFGRAELAELLTVAEDHGLLCVSNEIYADLVFDGSFTPLVAEARGRPVMTLNGPTKAFNLSGLGGGYVHINDSGRMARVRLAARYRVAPARTLQRTAMAAVYSADDDWWRDLLAYLRGNRDLLVRELVGALPGLACHVPRAGLFLWVRGGGLGAGMSLAALLRERAHVRVNCGTEFGGAPDCFRVTFGSDRAVVREAIRRMRPALAAAGHRVLPPRRSL